MYCMAPYSRLLNSTCLFFTFYFVGEGGCFNTQNTPAASYDLAGYHYHGRLQAWERGALPPLKCCKVFCASVFTVKRSVDQLFMHYFHNFSSALPPDPTGAPHLHPAGGLSFPDPLIFPPLEKTCGLP